MTIQSCIDELLAVKRTANKTTRYIESLGAYLRQFSKGREGADISGFDFDDITGWMDNYKNPDTRRTWLSRLSALFSYCSRRGYIRGNPCDVVERVTIDRPAPAIILHDKAWKLYRWTKMSMRPYVVLGVFVGLRPEEIPRLNWSHINLEAGTVLATGKRRTRLVQLQPLAVELLKLHPLQRGKVCPCNSVVDRWRLKARELLGFDKWPQDLLRHTAASHLLALLKDEGKVATLLGTSVKTLRRHYLHPVTDQDCAAFWRHRPASAEMPRTDLNNEPGHSDTSQLNLTL